VFLHQIKQTGAKAENQGRIAGEDQCDVRKQPACAHSLGCEKERRLPCGSNESQKKYHREDDDAGRSRVIHQVHQQKCDHDQKAQYRFGIVHGNHGHFAGLKKSVSQRDEMKDHAQIGGMEGDAVEQVTAAGQSHQGVKQSHRVAAERNPQPKYRHRWFESSFAGSGILPRSDC
jgi:hypothetical protein